MIMKIRFDDQKPLSGNQIEEPAGPETGPGPEAGAGPEAEVAPGPEAATGYCPTVDLTPVLVTAEIVIGAVVITRVLARALGRRPSVPRTKVTMGPGGWVSVKGGTVGVRPGSRPWQRPRRVNETRPSARAPIWARVISAVPLRALAG